MKQDNTKEGAFSKENSLAIKGIAILMMMWHHCFLSGRFEEYTIDFRPLSERQIINVAVFCKVCVSLFVFVSGYGLYYTWLKAQKNNQSESQWICEKLIRTLSNYWFIVVPSWLVCTILDNRPYHVYGFENSKLMGVWNMVIEFLGLTNLVGGTQLNGTWWYMSAAVAFIVLLPLIIKCFEKVGCFCTLSVILILPRISFGYPGDTNFYSFLPIFCIGMIFARYDLFARWNRFWGSKPIYIRVLKFFLCAASLLISYKLSYHMKAKLWWDVKWNLFPILIIIFAYDYLCRVPFLSKPLIVLGKHATNIFLIHTFIRAIYCKPFVYGRGHFVFVLGTILITSLVLSIVIEGLKRVIHYEVWINKLLSISDKLMLIG